MLNQQRLGKAINQLMQMRLECARELNTYTQYILRCLIRSQQPYTMDDFVHVQFENKYGISEAIVYPKTSVMNGKGIINPAFFKGYNMTLIPDERVFKINFSENANEFMKELDEINNTEHKVNSILGGL